MPDLTPQEWAVAILARLDEREALAQAALDAAEPGEPWGYGHLPDDGPHIAAHDPEWTLRDVAQKRKAVERDRLVLERHVPRNDGSLSLMQYAHCGCGQREVRMMDDAFNSIVPIEWPCPDAAGALDSLRGLYEAEVPR